MKDTNYTNWDDDQPNNDDDRCVYFKRTAKWNDHECSDSDIQCFACNSPLDSYNGDYLNNMYDYNYSIFNISVIVGNETNAGSNDAFYFGIIGNKYDTITYEINSDYIDFYTLDTESYWIKYTGFYESNSTYTIYPKVPRNIGHISKLIIVPDKNSDDAVKVDKVITHFFDSSNLDGYNIEILSGNICQGIILDFVHDDYIEFSHDDGCPFSNYNNTDTVYLQPSLAPTINPSARPTMHPSDDPTAQPSSEPTTSTLSPTGYPSLLPSNGSSLIDRYDTTYDKNKNPGSPPNSDSNSDSEVNIFGYNVNWIVMVIGSLVLLSVCCVIIGLCISAGRRMYKRKNILDQITSTLGINTARIPAENTSLMMPLLSNDNHNLTDDQPTLSTHDTDESTTDTVNHNNGNKLRSEQSLKNIFNIAPAKLQHTNTLESLNSSMGSNITGELYDGRTDFDIKKFNANNIGNNNKNNDNNNNNNNNNSGRTLINIDTDNMILEISSMNSKQVFDISAGQFRIAANHEDGDVNVNVNGDQEEIAPPGDNRSRSRLGKQNPNNNMPGVQLQVNGMGLGGINGMANNFHENKDDSNDNAEEFSLESSDLFGYRYKNTYSEGQAPTGSKHDRDNINMNDDGTRDGDGHGHTHGRNTRRTNIGGLGTITEK